MTDADFRTAGVFSELTFGRGQPSRWVAGLRLDRARATDRRATVTNAMMTVANPTSGTTRTEHLGSAFFRHERDLTGGWTWYAGLGHSERMPDYWELFSPDAGPMGSINAFSAIQPEKTTQLDVGAQFRSAALDAWVSAYAGKVQDYILFTYASGGMMGDTTRAANVDARIAGGEAGIEWRPSAGWKLGSTLAYAWGENRRNTARWRRYHRWMRVSRSIARASTGSAVRCCGRWRGRGAWPTGRATWSGATSAGARVSPRSRSTAATVSMRR
jgi:iron complex outermembrane receptor protein